MKTLSLYSRPGCHLCELLAAEVAPLLGSGFEIHEVDISEHPALTRKYGLRIPVLADGETEISGYPLDVSRLQEYLSQR
jgi:hypothetical protein